MAKKTYIIKDKGKGQLDTVDPNSLVSISEQTASNGVQSIVPGDNITVDNTDPQNPIISSTGGTPTLAEVLAVGNNAGDEVIKFEWEEGIRPPFITQTIEIGKDDPTTNNFSIRNLQNNRRIDFFGQYDPAGLDLYRSRNTIVDIPYTYWEIGNNGSDHMRGLVGTEYYGANYNDNTYVQKKYVDDTQSYFIADDIRTGGTWIDGKPIYRTVLEDTLDNSGLSEITGLNNSLYLDSFVSLEVLFADEGSDRYFKLEGTFDGNTVSVLSNTGNTPWVSVIMTGSNPLPVNTKVLYIIEYTKTTD